MEEEDYTVGYLRDQIIIEEEKRIRMEAEWMEAEYYREKEEQLPAKIITIKTPKEHENTVDS